MWAWPAPGPASGQAEKWVACRARCAPRASQFSHTAGISPLQELRPQRVTDVPQQCGHHEGGPSSHTERLPQTGKQAKGLGFVLGLVEN